jgi:hypothetical protein
MDVFVKANLRAGHIVSRRRNRDGLRKISGKARSRTAEHSRRFVRGGGGSGVASAPKCGGDFVKCRRRRRGGHRVLGSEGYRKGGRTERSDRTSIWRSGQRCTRIWRNNQGWLGGDGTTSPVSA